MSETNVTPAASDSPAVGATPRRGLGVLRAALYAPVVLIVSAMGAVAMFPDLAEYASPLIGNSSGSECTCPIARLAHLIGQGKSAGEGCSSQAISSGSCSAARSCSASAMSTEGCCPHSGSCPSTSAETASEPATSLDLTAVEEVPADAFAAANNVDLDTPSN